MHLKVFGAIILLLRQVTINGWKLLPGPGFWNPSQKKVYSFSFIRSVMFCILSNTGLLSSIVLVTCNNWICIYLFVIACDLKQQYECFQMILNQNFPMSLIICVDSICKFFIDFNIWLLLNQTCLYICQMVVILIFTCNCIKL